MDKRRRLLAVLVFANLLASCGGGGGGDGATCSPAPAITSTPPTNAAVNQQYQYQVNFTLACIPLLSCGFELLQAPPGAGINARDGIVFWTPSASDANHTVQFKIATFNDLCGHRATQSWLVLVSP
jgi:hypothetical protein